MTPKETTELELQSTFALSGTKGETLTFSHKDGREIAVLVVPQKHANGKLRLYEPWKKDPTGKLQRLFTERGYEWVFELPLLLEFHLEKDGYPTDSAELVERFYTGMIAASFKNYPRELFR